jgi:hypothetical protein
MEKLKRFEGVVDDELALDELALLNNDFGCLASNALPLM